MKINQIDEKWSKKYKRSIDCDNPKGFSQRAHCDGRKKTNEDIGNLPDWETIVAVAAAAKLTPMAVKAMWSTAKGAYKLKKFADKAGIKLADKLVGEAGIDPAARQQGLAQRDAVMKANPGMSQMDAGRAVQKQQRAQRRAGLNFMGNKIGSFGNIADHPDADQLSAIVNKERSLRRTVPEARKDPMDKEVQVPGVASYSLGALQRNVAAKLHDLADRAAKNDPYQFRQIKKLLDDGILQLFLDSIVDAYDDLARQTVHRRQFGEAEEQELPIDMKRIRDLIQRLESDRYITPEQADEMRRATQAMASNRDTLTPDAVLQLLTMVA